MASTPVEITLRAVPDQMRYDVTEVKVFVGDRVRLVFRNDDFMPHNVVVCWPRDTVTPGAEEDNGMEVALAAWTLGERATAMQWVPEHPRVFAATKILEGQGVDTIEFTVPEEPGRYPYVCTFPGHAASMFGIMHVQARVDGLRDLRYRVFRGSFTAFPDFAELQDRVITQGTLSDGLIDAAVGGAEQSFAVEFEGQLSISRDGDYSFTVAGDNGPLLLIDDQIVVDHRSGRSWESSATQTVRLSRGERRIVLRYWHRRDQRKRHPEVTLLWSSGEFKELPLSRVDLIDRRRQMEAERAIGMPIGPVDGEPMLYRNYLAGVLPSGFGVGYPGGINLTWDPVRMNVGSLWAGAFFDVKRHRTLRGGTIKPIGFAMLDPAPGPPFAFITESAQPWPDDASARNHKYRFLGYALDAQRRPTFRYRFGEITVTDFFLPHGTVAAGDLRLTRTLVLSAEQAPESKLMFRVLRAAEIEAQHDGYLAQKMILVAPGGSAVLRSAGANKEVLLPVVFRHGQAKIEITYSWAGHHH